MSCCKNSEFKAWTNPKFNFTPFVNLWSKLKKKKGIVSKYIIIEREENKTV